MSRGSNNSHATITMKVPVFKTLLKEHEQFNTYEREMRYNERNKNDPDFEISIEARRFSKKALEDLLAIYKKAGSQMGDRHAMGQAQGHLDAINSPDSMKIKTLQSVETAIKKLIQKNAIRGWLFHKDENTGVLHPVLITSVNYHPRYEDSPAYVRMAGTYSSKESLRSVGTTWSQKEVRGQTPTQLLQDAGFFLEAKALIADYDKQEAQYLDWRTQLGEQFMGKGVFTAQETVDDGWWTRSKRTKTDMDSRHKLVVNDKCKELILRQENWVFSHVDGEDLQESGDSSDNYTQVPVLPYIWCFNLETHTEGWVFMESMTPYQYRPELREKLVLSQEHSDLVDALTGDMDVLQEDIVSGKTGGTAIMCQGKPGTGKTLLAEIYAEVIKRPLYRVHSGQLGTNASSVESVLKKALDNAAKRRAAMLIDEADVFVAERGSDIEKNAVISVFLRVMEYYPGLLFLTTNRIDSIDEAILSRCIAQIKFDVPGEEERVKLWSILGEQFEFPLIKTKGMPEKLAKQFPKAVGRDIKGIIRLTVKHARKRNVKIDMPLVIRLAAFKGL